MLRGTLGKISAYNVWVFHFKRRDSALFLFGQNGGFCPVVLKAVLSKVIDSFFVFFLEGVFCVYAC